MLPQVGQPYLAGLLLQVDPVCCSVLRQTAVIGRYCFRHIEIIDPFLLSLSLIHISGALIGFAGPRVIEQTIGQKLPEGFQRSEYLEEHGFVDAVVPRGQMKSTLMQLLRLHAKGGARRG